jgi:type I restriction enzyme S subunit
MRSSYKPIGRFIRLVKTRNAGLEVTELRGIRINKEFMPSVANVIGTDLGNYKVVRKNQFAYNPMHVGRDGILPIARLEAEEPVIVSPAYVVFEIRNPDELLPEYLMMWCRRPEFDRQAWFTTDSSVRGGFDWKDFCEMEMPVPSPEKQREIVAEYETVVNRIALNERLGRKLEETAQAIYKHWFVDFEFPMSAEYAKKLGKPELEGKPYKSSGGEMIHNEALEDNLPANWDFGCWGDIATVLCGFAFPGEEYSTGTGIAVARGENVSEQFFRWDTRKTWDHELPARAAKCRLQEWDIIIGMDGSKVGKNWAIVSKYDLPMILAQRVACVRGNRSSFQCFLYFSMFSDRFFNHVCQVATGTSVPHISAQQILDFQIVIPDINLLGDFARLIKGLLESQKNQISINSNLEELRTNILSKMALQPLASLTASTA